MSLLFRAIGPDPGLNAGAKCKIPRYRLSLTGWDVAGNLMKRNRRLGAPGFVRPSGAAEPAGLPAKLGAALALHRAGRWAEAEAAYTEILFLYPEQPQALHLLGAAKLQQGALEEAVGFIRRAIALKPNDAQAHNNLGEGLRKLDRLEEAEASFRRALELKPDYGKAHSNLGRVLCRLGRWAEAETSLRRAIELQPGDIRALHRLGETLRLLGRPEEAEQILRRAIALQPDDAALHFDLGLTLQESERPEAAAVCYARALAIDPRHDAVKNNLALILPYLADPRREVTRCRSTLAENAASPEAHRKLGIALWQCGETAEARTELREALRLEPRDAVALYGLGLVAKTEGKLTEAADWIRQSLALDAADVYARAAAASIEAALTDARRGSRVALHLNQRYHYRILRPVFDALCREHMVLLTPHVNELVEFDPDVVVVAESQSGLLRRELPRAQFVWVRHGLISKNTTCFAARSADFACLTSEASRDWYIAQGGRPRRDIWITGYPQMDSLFRESLPAPLQLPAGRKMLLYAPTWTTGLSSAPMLGERTVELLRGARRDLSIVIKPHPVTADHHPEWLATWRALADADPDVHLIDDRAADVMPYLKAADVLVSDASSVIFEYLALDRPIVLVTNPERRRVAHFDSSGIEWRWRDVGTEVHDVAHLAAAVSAALDNPAFGADRRAHYREQLFGSYTDGRSAERIAQKIKELGL